MAQTPQRLGIWPRVNLALVKDYPELGDEDAGVFFRIHLDIPIAEKLHEPIDKLLKQGNLAGVFEQLKPEVKPGNDANQRRAYATVAGALGQG